MASIRTYVVSGSASGIGAATRARLEAEGHRVIGTDLHDAEVAADLATPQGRDTAVQEIGRLCDGVLHGFVGSAGIGVPAPAETIIRVNYFGAQALLTGLRPALAAADLAQVVQIGSNSASTVPNLPDELVSALLADDESRSIALLDEAPREWRSVIGYGASKLAITRWARRRATGRDWIGRGIRLNVLAPGAVRTPLLQAGLDDPVYGPLIEAFPIPSGAPAGADAIAAWVEFLLGSAARHACGSVFYVDGGTDASMRADDWPNSGQL